MTIEMRIHNFFVSIRLLKIKIAVKIALWLFNSVNLKVVGIEEENGTIIMREME